MNVTMETPDDSGGPLNIHIALAAVSASFSVVGLLGNGTVILTVVFSRRLQRRLNAFLLNLAICDLLSCAALPFQAVALLSPTGDWPLAPAICVGTSVFNRLPAFNSMWLMALIAVNRCLKITRSPAFYRRAFSKRNLVLMNAGTWCLMVAYNGFLLAMGMPFGYNRRNRLCFFDHHVPGTIGTVLKGVRVTLVGVPLIVIVASYGMIIRFIRSHVRTVDVAVPVSTTSGADRSRSPMPATPRAITGHPDVHEQARQNDVVGNPNTSDREGRGQLRHHLHQNQPAARLDEADAAAAAAADGGGCGGGHPRQNRWLRLEMRIVRSLALLTCVFILCWIPIGTLTFESRSGAHVFVVITLAWGNSTCNPFLYGRHLLFSERANNMGIRERLRCFKLPRRRINPARPVNPFI